MTAKTSLDEHPSFIDSMAAHLADVGAGKFLSEGRLGNETVLLFQFADAINAIWFRRIEDSYFDGVFTLRDDEVDAILFHGERQRDIYFYFQSEFRNGWKFPAWQLLDLGALAIMIGGDRSKLPAPSKNRSSGETFYKFNTALYPCVISQSHIEVSLAEPAVVLPFPTEELQLKGPNLEGLEHPVERGTVVTLYRDGGWYTSDEVGHLHYMHGLTLAEFFSYKPDGFSSVMSRLKHHPNIESRHRPMPKGQGRGRAEFHYRRDQ